MLSISKSKLIILLFFLVGGISMVMMSMHYFQNDVSGVMKGKVVQEEFWYKFSLRTHIVFGLVAILLGPFQFIDSIRLKNAIVHKSLGYIYSVSVCFSAVTGLIVAQFPMGGIVSRLGFSTLAIFWLYSLCKSISAILRQDLSTHRKWMFINYGLTFAAIPQRTLLLVPLIFEIDFMNIYRLSAWLPWMMNALIAVLIHKNVTKSYPNLKSKL